MSNTQFFILLGTVLAGVIWQRVDVAHLTARVDVLGSNLTSRVDALGTRLDGRIDRISDDMRQFYRTLGSQESRLDNVEKRQG